MDKPTQEEMEFAKSESDLLKVLTHFKRAGAELTPLKNGERVYFLTVGGEYPGTVCEAWRDDDLTQTVKVILDTSAEMIAFHRGLFRAFTALDRISEA